MRRFAEAVWTMLGWLFKGQPLPMQCALFAARSDVDALCRQIPKEGAIYLDGIRLYVLARRLRAERPSQRIVMDIDDLLSRRTDLLLKGRQPQSPGYLTEQFSLFTRFLIAAFSRWILIYERWALRGVERRSVAIADAAVLVSAAEADELRANVGERLAVRVQVIPPPVEPVAPPPAAFDHLERFIFVGADVLTQNRLTIDYLIKLWRRYRPSTPLVLFGIQQRDRPLPEGMSAAGYVESLSDIYNPQSVLLTPSFIGGGIKTKVLEAFAHRVPVIGNSDTFESLALADYPLAVTEESQLIEMVLQPDKFGPALRHAAEEGYAYVQDRYPPTVFADRWRAVLALPKLPDRRTLS
jgi:glycosyltransferase involved in cell wall biosynthesis